VKSGEDEIAELQATVDAYETGFAQRSPPSNSAATNQELADLRSSLEAAVQARDAKDDLLELKEKDFESQRGQMMETITRLTEESKESRALLARLREELDATKLALDSSEGVCRDALSALALEM
jgi:chromosome segregation ATPase